jgi:hypothetical protein
MPNERIFEELPLGHKVEQRPERKADDRDIHPILMLRENDRRPVIRKSFLPLDLKVIKDGEDHLGRSFGEGIDKEVSFHNHFQILPLLPLLKGGEILPPFSKGD